MIVGMHQLATVHAKHVILWNIERLKIGFFVVYISIYSTSSWLEHDMASTEPLKSRCSLSML